MNYLGHYISLHKGCRHLKFLHALEFHQVLLAHTTNGVGGPLKNVKGYIKKLA